MHRLLVFMRPFFISFYSARKGTLAPGTVVDSIAVMKGERKMYVYHNDRLLKVYDISLGRQPVGVKQYKGDMHTPEHRILLYLHYANFTYICILLVVFIFALFEINVQVPIHRWWSGHNILVAIVTQQNET